MSTTPINSATTGAAATVGNTSMNLNSQDFIKMMMTELQNQDPLNPTDAQAMLSQMSSIGQLQSSSQLQTTLTQFSFQNQLAAASNLIGKTIQGIDETNNKSTGVVTGVSAVDNQVWLQMDNGHQVQMGNVLNISSTATTNTAALNTASISEANQAAAAALLQQATNAQ